MNSIIVTGGLGFIGSNFIRILLNENLCDSVLNVDRQTYAGNPENLIEFEKDSRYQFLKADIGDTVKVESAISEFGPTSIINFAAESHVDRSIEGPAEFIQTNVVGTLNLLEQSRIFINKTNNDNFRFLHVSTDEVYGSLGDDGKFLETTPYDPSSPYSASKAGSDHLVRAWNRTFGLPTLITNCSNNYGSYQFPEKLVPLMIINCLQGNPLPVYGKGVNVRDWLFVGDHCDAIHTVLAKGEMGETYNIGGNNEIKNIDVVTIICSFLDEISPRKNGSSYSDLITFVKDRPGHDFRYAIDAGKIQNDLGWSPNESFETGIRKTIHWYLDNQNWWKAIQDNNYRQERLGVI